MLVIRWPTKSTGRHCLIQALGHHAETCENTDMAVLSPLQPSAGNNVLPVALPAGHDVVRTIRDAIFGCRRDKIDSGAYGRRELLPKFATTYRSLQKLAAVMELPRIK